MSRDPYRYIWRSTYILQDCATSDYVWRDLAGFVAIRPDASYSDRLAEIWHDDAIIVKIWLDLAKFPSVCQDLTGFSKIRHGADIWRYFTRCPNVGWGFE